MKPETSLTDPRIRKLTCILSKDGKILFVPNIERQIRLPRKVCGKIVRSR